MKLKEFIEKFIAHNTCIHLYEQKIEYDENKTRYDHWIMIWQGMDWQCSGNPEDDAYFESHPGVTKCPYLDNKVIKVIGNPINNSGVDVVSLVLEGEE